MTHEILSYKEFKHLIQSGVSLIDCHAPWCAPCRLQDPILDGLNRSYRKKVTLVKVDIDQNQEVALSLRIQSIPTLIFYRDGCERRRFIGLQTRETLEKVLKKVLSEYNTRQGLPSIRN